MRDVPEDLWRKVKVMAAKRDVTVGAIVIEALRQYFPEAEGAS